MARSFPSPIRCQFSLDQNRRRLSRCGVRKSWDASRQSIKRQNGDPLSSCGGTVSSSLHLSCILSFLVCLGGSLVSVSLFAVLFFAWAPTGLRCILYSSRNRAGGLCSRTLILRQGSREFPTRFIAPVNPATWKDVVVCFVLLTCIALPPPSVN
jgi:hypothetical protein